MSKGISMFYEYFPKVCSLGQDGVETCLLQHEPSQWWHSSAEKGSEGLALVWGRCGKFVMRAAFQSAPTLCDVTKVVLQWIFMPAKFNLRTAKAQKADVFNVENCYNVLAWVHWLPFANVWQVIRISRTREFNSQGELLELPLAHDIKAKYATFHFLLFDWLNDSIFMFAVLMQPVSRHTS